MNTTPDSAPRRQSAHGRQAAHGRQSAYGERAGSYERDTAAFQPYRRAVVEALPLRSGQVVLDVGCGTGLCCGPLRDKVGPGGGVVGIEESPEMAKVAREHIACEGWDNVTVVQAPAEDAEIGSAADAALFCAVHDILQSPDALRNVVTGLRPGAWVAAGGGKWAAPIMVALNSMVGALHAPYVRDFSGFDRPWRHLERLVEDVQVRELAFGSGYVMTGRTPA
jgi:SAM-dependent methyltransferase